MEYKSDTGVAYSNADTWDLKYMQPSSLTNDRNDWFSYSKLIRPIDPGGLPLAMKLEYWKKVD